MSKICDLYNGKPGFQVFSANNSFEFKTAKTFVYVCVCYLFIYLFNGTNSLIMVSCVYDTNRSLQSNQLGQKDNFPVLAQLKQSIWIQFPRLLLV